MKDLAVNFVGAVVFSVIGYFYVKNRGKGGFASRFIPRVVDVLPEDLDDWKGLRWSRRSRRDKDSDRKPE